jgi:hypothetical protein
MPTVFILVPSSRAASFLSTILFVNSDLFRMVKSSVYIDGE